MSPSSMKFFRLGRVCLRSGVLSPCWYLSYKKQAKIKSVKLSKPHIPMDIITCSLNPASFQRSCRTIKHFQAIYYLEGNIPFNAHNLTLAKPTQEQGQTHQSVQLLNLITLLPFPICNRRAASQLNAKSHQVGSPNFNTTSHTFTSSQHLFLCKCHPSSWAYQRMLEPVVECWH